jgi:TetR/AcrR family transcriptional regulator, copper-responsive repressor
MGIAMTPDASPAQKSPRPRGRPREFDTADVLDIIRACFARKGFSATSIEDLSEATGLSTPSLYNAFGDKRAMFLQALDLESVEVLSRLLPLRDEKPSIDRLYVYVEAIAAGYDSTTQTPRIAFGAALADAATDSEVASRLRNFLSTLDSVATDLLGPNTSPSAAILLSTLAIGLCVRSRAGVHASGEVEITALLHLLARSALAGE